MRIGRMNRFVTLSRNPDVPGTEHKFEPLNPQAVWCAIEPLGPTIADETRMLSSRVTMRFHKEVTIDTRIVYADPVLGRDRELFVRGVQNVDDANDTLVLFCEEVVP